VRRSRWGILLLVVLLAHLVFGLARVPHSVVGKRAAERHSYNERGRVRYLLDTKHHKGADAVQWILDNTVEDSVFLWRGQYKGSFELVAHLIYPRLLYEESRVARHIDKIHGRPVSARVLVGRGNDLELVER
jgi:hypothetical protein